MKRRIGFKLAVFAMTAAAVIAQEADAEGWIALFNGKNLDGWKPRHGQVSGWSVKDSAMVNTPPSVDLVSEMPMSDCELYVEFMVPKGSNSGVYLQGRYEVQVLDSHGFALSRTICGAIYDKIAPSVNAAKPAGEWQSFQITFRQAVVAEGAGKTANTRVTVIHNGIKIIDDAEVDGPTGAAVDDNEGKPAGLMLQGDHGPVQYRNIKMRPLQAVTK